MTSTDALMALPQERQEKQRPLDRTQLKGALELRQISFTYPGQSAPALNNVSLRLGALLRLRRRMTGMLRRRGGGRDAHLAPQSSNRYKPFVTRRRHVRIRSSSSCCGTVSSPLTAHGVSV